MAKNKHGPLCEKYMSHKDPYCITHQLTIKTECKVHYKIIRTEIKTWSSNADSEK